MELSIYISMFSTLLAMMSFLYTLISNKDKFILTSNERKNLLEWYERVNFILVKMKQASYRKERIDKDTLTELSALIDLGRFYFPNNTDNIGKNKPEAYRGHRSNVIDLLVYAYEIGHAEQIDRFQEHLRVLQQRFTSEIFKVLKPRKYMSYMKRITYIDIKLGEENYNPYNDFIGTNDPWNFEFYPGELINKD